MATKEHDKRNIIFIYLLVLIYAVLRYNVFKGVPWDHLPLYVLNKTFALAGIILLSQAFILNNWIQSEQNLIRAKQLGWFGFHLILLHVLCSFAILNPLYFSKFFVQGKMNLTGELSMLVGGAAFVVLTVNNIRSWLNLKNNEETSRVYKGYHPVLGILLVIAHVFIMGVKGWLTPSAWPGYLLPISLVSFLVLIAALTFAQVKPRR